MNHPAPISEALFLRLVLRLAQEQGWLAFHLFDSRRAVGHGFPDVVLARPGRLILAELKSEAGKLRPLQSTWLSVLGSCPGVSVFLWRPSSWPEIAATLSPPVRLQVVAASACLL